MRRQPGPRPVFRLIEQVGGAAHLPQVLYYWRVHAGSPRGALRPNPMWPRPPKRAIADHLDRTGQKGQVTDGLFPSTYRVVWEVEGNPKVSVLIPNKDNTRTWNSASTASMPGPCGKTTRSLSSRTTRSSPRPLPITRRPSAAMRGCGWSGTPARGSISRPSTISVANMLPGSTCCC